MCGGCPGEAKVPLSLFSGGGLFQLRRWDGVAGASLFLKGEWAGPSLGERRVDVSLF